jgi:hypothetical protein
VSGKPKNKNKKPDRTIHEAIFNLLHVGVCFRILCVGAHEKNKTRNPDENKLNSP